MWIHHRAAEATILSTANAYTPVPLGPPEELLVRLDSVLDEELGGKTIYYVQYCLMAYDKPLRSQDEWDRYRMEIVNGDTPIFMRSGNTRSAFPCRTASRFF